jgi:beta-alanine degradation protein BauB
VQTATRQAANDPVALAPNTYKVPVENDRVRVLDIHLKPGEKVPLHSHPASVIYAVSACKAKFTYPEGGSEVIDMKEGESIWTEAYTHEPENIGDSECHFLQIELRE